MVYFEPDFLKFFKELAANNHKDWFDQNRERYHRVVREPFKVFVQDLINEVRKRDPKVNIEPKEAIFRINRDIRFSKNKMPYKNHVSAIVSRYGKADKSYPGLYVQLEPEKLGIYGGLYRLSTQQTADLRYAIAENLSIFEKFITAPRFKSVYGEIHGEKAKRIPKELKEKASAQPLIFNKSLYFYAELPAQTILESSLMDTILEHYEVARPITQFIERNVFG